MDVIGTRHHMIEYRGWQIYWTGWKEDWAMSVRDPADDDRSRCYICEKPIGTLERVSYEFTRYQNAHWICKHPDNRHGWLCSQWIAVRHPQYRDEKFVYVNCSAMPAVSLAGGRFQRGSAFQVPEGHIPITEFDSAEHKEYARVNGLARMFQLPDLEADGELENPVRYCYCKQCGGDGN